jgi:hypothetical protein
MQTRRTASRGRLAIERLSVEVEQIRHIADRRRIEGDIRIFAGGPQIGRSCRQLFG